MVQPADGTLASVLIDVTAKFDRQLASLRKPDARAKIDAALALEGDLTKLPRRPRAGESS